MVVETVIRWRQIVLFDSLMHLLFIMDLHRAKQRIVQLAIRIKGKQSSYIQVQAYNFRTGNKPIKSIIHIVILYMSSNQTEHIESNPHYQLIASRTSDNIVSASNQLTQSLNNMIYFRTGTSYAKNEADQILTCTNLKEENQAIKEESQLIKSEYQLRFEEIAKQKQRLRARQSQPYSAKDTKLQGQLSFKSNQHEACIQQWQTRLKSMEAEYQDSLKMFRDEITSNFSHQLSQVKQLYCRQLLIMRKDKEQAKIDQKEGRKSNQKLQIELQNAIQELQKVTAQLNQSKEQVNSQQKQIQKLGEQREETCKLLQQSSRQSQRIRLKIDELNNKFRQQLQANTDAACDRMNKIIGQSEKAIKHVEDEIQSKSIIINKLIQEINNLKDDLRFAKEKYQAILAESIKKSKKLVEETGKIVAEAIACSIKSDNFRLQQQVEEVAKAYTEQVKKTKHYFQLTAQLEREVFHLSKQNFAYQLAHAEMAALLQRHDQNFRQDTIDAERQIKNDQMQLFQLKAAYEGIYSQNIQSNSSLYQSLLSEKDKEIQVLKLNHQWQISVKNSAAEFERDAAQKRQSFLMAEVQRYHNLSLSQQAIIQALKVELGKAKEQKQIEQTIVRDELNRFQHENSSSKERILALQSIIDTICMTTNLIRQQIEVCPLKSILKQCQQNQINAELLELLFLISYKQQKLILKIEQQKQQLMSAVPSQIFGQNDWRYVNVSQSQFK